VNLRFTIKALLLAVPMAILITAVWILGRMGFTRIPDPTPLPPTIQAPQGEMPTGMVGLQEWAQYRDEPYRSVGSGFFLLLETGTVVGVTTAHSVSLGNPNHPLERIALGIAGHPDHRWEFSILHGLPGCPWRPGNLSADYVLLAGTEAIQQDLLVAPDPRGAPQPGERVTLYSGLGDGRGGLRVHEGTIQSVEDRGFWMLTDRWFNPAQMSGSPIISQHTGQVVGMVVVGSPRLGRIMLGAHPIGSLVSLATSATEFPTLSEIGVESR
jgi:hypothetical protein